MKLKKEIWKDINWYLPKDAHQKSDGGSVRSDFKKLDSFTLETSKNHLIRSFLRNGRLRVKNYYSFSSNYGSKNSVEQIFVTIGNLCSRLRSKNSDRSGIQSGLSTEISYESK